MAWWSIFSCKESSYTSLLQRKNGSKSNPCRFLCRERFAESACTFFTVQSCTDRRSETEILETRNGTPLEGWLKTISENLTPPLQNKKNTSPATVRTVPLLPPREEIFGSYVPAELTSRQNWWIVGPSDLFIVSRVVCRRHN